MFNFMHFSSLNIRSTLQVMVVFQRLPPDGPAVVFLCLRWTGHCHYCLRIQNKSQSTIRPKLLEHKNHHKSTFTHLKTILRLQRVFGMISFCASVNAGKVWITDTLKVPFSKKLFNTCSLLNTIGHICMRYCSSTLITCVSRSKKLELKNDSSKSGKALQTDVSL